MSADSETKSSDSDQQTEESAVREQENWRMAQRAPRNSYQKNEEYRDYKPSRRRLNRSDDRRDLRNSYNRRPTKKRRRKKRHGGRIVVLLIIVLLIAGGMIAWKMGLFQKAEEIVADVRPLPAAPAVSTTAMLGATGDILLHRPVNEAHAAWDGGYDFSYCFDNVAAVYQQADLMFANLEVTLGGPESGEYTGYPGFNSPDEIVPALKNAGVDVCLTANNHSYDTGYYGMMRTLDVLDEYGVGHLGSRETTNEHYLMTRNINGIRLGMLCYTYDTREYTEGEISLNFNYLNDEAVQKICTFNYEYLDEFYAEIQQQMDYMDMLNVDARVIFMHWGTEYQDEPNDYQQRNIAQQLCNMGFDVIIGGHPHVIQELDTLISPDGHETICLYSMGNELSNQRKEEMVAEDGGRGYTEDGLVIQVTFEKFNNGKTKVGAVNIVPTWVQLDYNGYQIIGMENASDPWGWGSGDTYSAIASYNRTLERLGDEYPAYRIRKNQTSIVSYIE